MTRVVESPPSVRCISEVDSDTDIRIGFGTEAQLRGG